MIKFLNMDGHTLVPVTFNHRDCLLPDLDTAGHRVGQLSPAQDRPQLELHLGAVAGLLAVDADLPTQLPGHRPHQNSLTVGVWHRHVVVLAGNKVSPSLSIAVQRYLYLFAGRSLNN